MNPFPRVPIVVDDRPISAEAGTTVAAALVNAGVSAFRTSRGASPRGPLCGMGICHECRVTIDGIPHRRSCVIEVAEGMRIETRG